MGIVRHRTRHRKWWGIALAAALVPAGSLLAQNTKMPSTVCWGSGHVDVPSAGVLSHMALVGTVSGFWVSVDENPIVGGQVQTIALDGSLEKFYTDGVVSFGLFDRAELGAVLHSLDDNGTGTIVGGYGQFALLRPNPTGSGIGLAVGLRAITRPDYDDNFRTGNRPARVPGSQPASELRPRSRCQHELDGVRGGLGLPQGGREQRDPRSRSHHVRGVGERTVPGRGLPALVQLRGLGGLVRGRHTPSRCERAGSTQRVG